MCRAQDHRSTGWERGERGRGWDFFFFLNFFRDRRENRGMERLLLWWCSFGSCKQQWEHGRREWLVGQHPELATADHGGGQVHHKGVRL